MGLGVEAEVQMWGRKEWLNGGGARGENGGSWGDTGGREGQKWAEGGGWRGI